MASYFSLVINFEVPLQQRDERRWVATTGEKEAGLEPLRTPPLDSLLIGRSRDELRRHGDLMRVRHVWTLVEHNITSASLGFLKILLGFFCCPGYYRALIDVDLLLFSSIFTFRILWQFVGFLRILWRWLRILRIFFSREASGGGSLMMYWENVMCSRFYIIDPRRSAALSLAGRY